MRTTLGMAVVLLSTSVTYAERSTTVNLGGMIGGAETRVDEATRMEPAGGPRLVLSFEHPQPVLPPTKETSVDLTVVPELIAAAVMNAQSGEVMVGVGARGEVRISHRVARIAFYGAGRALVVGEHQDSAGELSFGEYVYLSSRLRLGGEASVMLRDSSTFMTESGSTTQHVIMASVYLGWAM